MIVQRYEKGQKFLDLHRWFQRELDDDGVMYEQEIWEVAIWENGTNPDECKTIEFGNETLARMFVDQNGWKEQVL